MFILLLKFSYFFKGCHLNSLLAPVEQSLQRISKSGKNTQTSSYPSGNFHVLTEQMGPPFKNVITRSPSNATELIYL